MQGNQSRRIRLIRSILTVASLAALIAFGFYSTEQENLAASKLRKILPEQHQNLKQANEPRSTKDDNGDDTAKVVGIATLVVLLVQSWIFARQAGIMNRQADIYSEQADLMDGQLKATNRAAVAAENAAEATQASVELARSTSASINRAYVGFIGVSAGAILNPHTEAVEGLALQVTVRNAGQTPTRKVLGSVQTRFLQKDPGREFDYRVDEGKSFWPEISSGETRGFTQIRVPIQDWSRLTGEDKPCFYIWGWIEYSDVFDRHTRHRTEFCVKLLAEGDLGSKRFTVGCEPSGPHNATDHDCLYKPQTVALAT